MSFMGSPAIAQFAKKPFLENLVITGLPVSAACNEDALREIRDPHPQGSRHTAP